MLGRTGYLVRRGFVTTVENMSKGETLVSLNWAGRDHDQSAFGNGIRRDLGPETQEMIRLFGLLNGEGEYKIAGRMETGGQELGKCAETGVRVGHFLQEFHNLAPNIQLRSLSRGLYGNSVRPLHPEELKLWYNFVQSKGQDLGYKVFDYNSNFFELEGSAQLLQNIGPYNELAFPHSPEESYQEFFRKKLIEGGEFASRYGFRALSIKRMVAGLTEREVQNIAHWISDVALANGIEEVALHAHGDTAIALANFVKIVKSYGIPKVSVDVVHDGSGTGKDRSENLTFPGTLQTLEALDNVGVCPPISQRQYGIINDINKLAQDRDDAYNGIRVSATWSVQKKVDMGVPDGGESYTKIALMSSGLGGDLKISQEFLEQTIFPIFYINVRKHFGGLTSVTPGHKRAETIAIKAISNSIAKIKEYAEEKSVPISVLAESDFAKIIADSTIESLYSGVSDQILDAFRNDEMPQELSEDVFSFICKSHMRNILKQSEFENLSYEDKEALIDASTDKDKVKKIASGLVESGTLPEEVLSDINNGGSYSKMSVVDHSGKREYSEAASVPNRIESYRKALDKMLKKHDIKMSNKEKEEAVAEIILTGDPAYLEAALTKGPQPSAKGLSKEEHQKAVLEYMQSKPKEKDPTGIEEFPEECLDNLWKAAVAGELTGAGYYDKNTLDMIDGSGPDVVDGPDSSVFVAGDSYEVDKTVFESGRPSGCLVDDVSAVSASQCLDDKPQRSL